MSTTQKSDEEILDEAVKILSAAKEYQPEVFLYIVKQGTDRDRMREDGSMGTYCKKCIDAAVMDKKREFFLERRAFMGKIYEYQTCGYIITPVYKWDKEGKVKGVELRKEVPKIPRKKGLASLRNTLRTKYPKSMKFDLECFDVSCSEHDGFENCDGCGVIFDQALLLTDQELEHWEIFECAALESAISTPYSAYQLTKIIEHWNPDKYADRVLQLAKRIINAAQ